MLRAVPRSPGDSKLTTASAIRVLPFVLTWPKLLGIDLEELARVAKLTTDQIEGRVDLSYEETLRLWDAMETITGDPAVGIHAGARFTLDQMGVVGPALAHNANLDAALDALARIMNVFVRNAEIRRIDADDGAGIAYLAPTLRSPHGIDTMFAAALTLMRHCTGVRLVPLRVLHQLGKRAESAYEGFYGVKPIWNASESQMWFRRSDLAKPFRGASSELATLLAEHAPRLMSPGMTSSSADADLESAFWTLHQRGDATLETVAHALRISPRTLQRRLADAGTTFAERRALILRHRAQVLLASDDVPIETIAERLGYSTRSAFERAFFRWTGQTPHAARQNALTRGDG